MNDRIVTSTPSAMLIAKHNATVARPRRVQRIGVAPPGASVNAAMAMDQVPLVTGHEGRWPQARRSLLRRARFLSVALARIMAASYSGPRLAPYAQHSPDRRPGPAFL